MGRVKGSAVKNLKVIPHNPVKHFITRVVSVFLMVGLVYLAYWYGGRDETREGQQLLIDRNQLQLALAKSVSREEALRQRVAVLENGAFVDKGSVDDVRKSNRELSDRIAQLEEEISLYQGIMSPSSDSAGLTIQEVALAETAAENRYRFKVMLTQVGNNTKYLSGSVEITILGVKDGEAASYPLKELSPEVNDVSIKFRYRYFQDFKGELALPEGFMPDQIQVVAQSAGSKSTRVEKAYNWSDLENGNNVGQ